MKYWIIIDDRHAGPFSVQQLLDTGLTADTLVWYEGLSDWTRAANVAELAEALQNRILAEAEARERLLAENEARRIAQEEEEASLRQAERREDETAAPQWEPQQPQPTLQPQSAVAITEPCPPAYIAWSIIATLLCCTIVGIPGIIFASMTKSAYYKGDLDKAKRYSELAQWFIIASIVLGTISWPFQIAFMGMMQ